MRDGGCCRLLPLLFGQQRTKIILRDGLRHIFRGDIAVQQDRQIIVSGHAIDFQHGIIIGARRLPLREGSHIDTASDAGLGEEFVTP